MNYQTERYIRDLFQEAQRGICPICQKPLAGRISLDHSHSTGEPRGLLHQQCNMKVAQIETHTKRLNYIISRLMLVELALQFRKKQPCTHASRSPAPKDAFGVARAGSLLVQYHYHTGRAIARGEASLPPHPEALFRPLHRRAQRSFASAVQYEGSPDRDTHEEAELHNLKAAGGPHQGIHRTAEYPHFRQRS